MLFTTIICVALFLALVAGLEMGRRLARKLTADSDASGTAAADGVVFAVLGLLIAFTFTTSASKFDERRRLIVEQVNALGTANLRLDVLPPEDRTAIRAKVTEWIDLALQTKQFSTDPARTEAALARADQLQNEVWQMTLAAVERKQQPPITAFVMSPLNDWIDLTSTRVAMNDMGLPPMVLPTLTVLSLVGAVLAGYGMGRSRRRRLVHTIAFAGAVSFSIYVILDLSKPREGLIKLDSMDEMVFDLRQSVAGPQPVTPPP